MFSYIKKLRERDEFKKYFFNTSWLFFEKAIKMLFGVFVIVLLTRYLGPENYGVFSYAQSFVAIFLALSTLGIDVILVRELAQKVRDSNELIGTAILLKVLVSIIAIVIIVVLNLFVEDKTAVYLTNIISLSLIFQGINCIDSYFQAKVLSKYTVIMNSSAFAVSSTVKILMIVFEAKLEYFAYSLVFDALLISMGYLFIFKLQKESMFLLKFNKEIALYYFKTGWPLLLVAVAAFIYTRIDQVMLKYLIGNTAVGYYSAATRLSELFYFIPILISQSIFPKILKAKTNSEDEYFGLLQKTYKVLIWIAIPIFLMFFFLSEYVILLVYGETFYESASILKVLSFSIVLNSIGVVSTKILYAEHYEKKYLYRSILGVFLNIALNFWFISIYGVTGAAVATILTLFFIYYIYDIFDKELHRFYYLKWICYLPTFK